MATFNGCAVKFAIGLSAITGIGTFEASKLGVKRNAKKKEVIARSGEVKGVYYYGKSKGLSLSFTPIGTSSAEAITNAKLPDIVGTKVVLTDSTDQDVDGSWLIDSMSKDSGNESETTWSMELTQYPDANVQVTVS
jgi:hypothetical protein